MATREEKIAFLQSQSDDQPATTREQKIAFLQAQAQKPVQPPSILDTQLPFGTTPRGIIQGGLDALPMAGMVAGGIAGSPADIVTGPMGTVVGAGIGASAGTALKKAGERFILGKQESNADVLKGTAMAVPEGMAGEMGGQVLGKGLSAAAGTKLGQSVINKAGSGAARVGEMFTGVPKQEIKTYAAHGPEVDAVSAANDHNPQDIADAIREKVNGVISAHKSEMNSQISKALADKTGSVESAPIIEKLESAKGKINSKLRPDEIGEVDELIAKVNAVSKDGQMSLQDAHDLKEYLSEQAKGTYQKGGQIFQRGEKAAQAAKAGAGATRELLNVAAPDVAAANGSLSRLHDIEDVMNKSMLAEGKTASPLMAAGSGNNPANAKVLRQLGDETGTDILGEAQKLAASRTFGAPVFLPSEGTGKAVARMGIPTLIGGAIGGLPGAAIGAAISNPAALKIAMNTGRAAASPAGQALASAGSKMLIQGNQDKLNKLIPNIPSTETAAPVENKLTEAPQKGEKKWMNDGAAKLIEHSPDDKDAIEKAKGAASDDKRIKDLLIKASDLKPGTPAMKKIMADLKARTASVD